MFASITPRGGGRRGAVVNVGVATVASALQPQQPNMQLKQEVSQSTTISVQPSGRSEDKPGGTERQRVRSVSAGSLQSAGTTATAPAQTFLHGRPTGDTTPAVDLVPMLRARGFQGDLSPHTRRSVAALTAQLETMSLDELKRIAADSEHPILVRPQELSQTLTASDNPRGLLVSMLVEEHAIQSETAEKSTSRDHVLDSSAQSSVLAIPAARSRSSTAGSSAAGGLDLSLVQEEDLTDEEMETPYDPAAGGSDLSYDQRSDSATLMMLSGVDVKAMETPRSTRGYQQPQQPRHSSLEKVRGIDAAGAAARGQAAELAAEQRRQHEEQAAELAAEQRHQHQQERIAASERQREAREEQRAAWTSVEASGLETANRMHALRSSQRQEADDAARQARDMAEEAVQHEAAANQRRRDAQGLTVSRLRVSGLPPTALGGSESNPFGRLRKPLVAATDGLSGACATGAVLAHLGGRLVAGAQPEDDCSSVGPAFGALAGAQGELCEALLAWVGEPEAQQQPEVVLGEMLAGWHEM
jgi:hypothetical protein